MEQTGSETGETPQAAAAEVAFVVDQQGGEARSPRRRVRGLRRRKSSIRRSDHKFIAWLRTHIDEAFDLLDEDKDGMVTPAQLCFYGRRKDPALKRKGDLYKEMALFDELDHNREGFLHREGFRDILLHSDPAALVHIGKICASAGGEEVQAEIDHADAVETVLDKEELAELLAREPGAPPVYDDEEVEEEEEEAPSDGGRVRWETELGPEELVGKMIHVESRGTAKVLSFNKVRVGLVFDSKHLLEFQRDPPTQEQMLLQRRKMGSWNGGSRFRVLDTPTEGAQRREGDNDVEEEVRVVQAILQAVKKTNSERALDQVVSTAHHADEKETLAHVDGAAEASSADAQAREVTKLHASAATFVSGDQHEDLCQACCLPRASGPRLAGTTARTGVALQQPQDACVVM